MQPARRLGALLIGLVVAVALLPATTLASNGTSNDLIFGGLGSLHPQATLLQVYDQDHDSAGHGGYHQLFAHFGINRSDLAATVHGTVNSGNHQILSIGRTPHAGDIQVFTAGGQTVYYLRPLYEFGNNISYPALIGHRHGDGAWFAILDNCGNIAIMNTPTPQPATPATPSTPAQPPTPTPTAQQPSAPMPSPTPPAVSATVTASPSITNSATITIAAPASNSTSNPASNPPPTPTPQRHGYKVAQQQSPTAASPPSSATSTTNQDTSGATTTEPTTTETAAASTPASTPTTTTAATLPQAGDATTTGLVGLSTILVAAWYYRRSRRQLVQALLQHTGHSR